MTISSHAQRPRTEAASLRWVPWAIVACFAVVFAVNGCLVYFALSSSTGLAVDEAYEKGLAYNRVIDEAERQETLGWRLTMEFVPASTEKEHGNLIVSARGRDGRPLDGLSVDAVLLRPVEPIPPVPVALQAHSGGLYTGDLAVPRPGQWDLHIAAHLGDTVYRTGRRIFVP